MEKLFFSLLNNISQHVLYVGFDTETSDIDILVSDDEDNLDDDLDDDLEEDASSVYSGSFWPGKH